MFDPKPPTPPEQPKTIALYEYRGEVLMVYDIQRISQKYCHIDTNKGRVCSVPRKDLILP